MNINDWISTYASINQDKIKIRINGNNMIHKNLSTYIIKNKLKYIDISDSNLTIFPDFVSQISRQIKGLILNNNKIKNIPNEFMDYSLNELEIFEIFNNPLELKNYVFKDTLDLVKNIKSIENKNYEKKYFSKYSSFDKQTKNNVTKYMNQFYNFESDVDNTSNINILTIIHKKTNIQNYDFYNRNKLHKFIAKSITNFLYQLTNDPTTNIVKSIDSNDILKMNMNIENIFSDKNLKEKLINLIQIIFLSEFLYNDENAVRFLAKGSYNEAYEVSEEFNLYIIKKLLNKGSSLKYEPYKEFIISIMLMEIGYISPNFTDPICIFNLNTNENKKYIEYEDDKSNSITPNYLCEFDEKYYFSNSQYVFHKNQNEFDRKTVFNQPSSSQNIENNYMTRNVEYGIPLDSYFEKIYKLGNLELNTKVLNILIQIIRALSLAYCRVGFYHGDGHCGNILINTLDVPTYIKEFYINPFYRYKFHKCQETVTFIDYGMSNLYYNKLDKLDKDNLLTYLNINSHNEMCNPVVDIHRVYYGILDKLYTDLFSKKFTVNKNNILYIIKLIYIYLGGFYYKDKRISINISNNDLLKIVNDDVKIKYNNKNYSFFDYDTLNYGYIPVYINGVQRDKIHNCFDIFNYFFSQYKKNISKIIMKSSENEFVDEVNDEYLEVVEENSKMLNDTFNKVKQFEDYNFKVMRNNIITNKQNNMVPNTEYNIYIIDLLTENDNIYKFVQQNIKSINTSLDINDNKIKDNKKDITTSLVYIVKSISIYITNLRKICLYNIINAYSNKIKIKNQEIDTSNMYNLIKNFINKLNVVKIPTKTKLSSYFSILNDIYKVLKMDTPQLIKKPTLQNPNLTAGVLSKKTVNELKVILDNLRKDNNDLVKKCVDSMKVDIPKFKKENYINCIMYVIKNL